MATHTALLKEPDSMGRFTVEFEIANYQDIIGVQLGVVQADKVRRMRLRGVVDTGATRLVLPATAVQQLGLPEMDETTVIFADGRRVTRKVAGGVELKIEGRSSLFAAIVEPGRTDALIGAVVLEELDFLADCRANKLVPRDPRGTLAEVE